MTIDVTEIVLPIIAVIAAIITKFLIPLFKAKIATEEIKLTENQATILKLAVNTAVSAAEQIYKSDEGQKKKSYVLNLLEQQGYKIDTAAFDAAVEAAVLELHNKLNR